MKSQNLTSSITGIVLLSAVFSLSLQADPVKARVFSVTGTVEYAAPGSSSYQTLTKDMILETGSTVRTGEDGQAVLTTTPGSAVQVASDTVLKINELAFAKEGDEVIQRKARLELKSGAVSALIDPKTPTVTDFQIQTPQGAAAARGTFYAVAVHGGKTYVSVSHGKVAAISAPKR